METAVKMDRFFDLVYTKCFVLRKHFVVNEYYVKKELIHMNCTNRTQKKIMAYSALFKKMGILNEEEYKNIAKTFQSKG
jgi:hypothetical protein